MRFQVQLPGKIPIHETSRILYVEDGASRTVELSGRSSLAALLRRLRVRNPPERWVEITRKGKAPWFEYEARIL